ncbi:S-phase kinase-associated protein 1, partial [Orchesella cincta]
MEYIQKGYLMFLESINNSVVIQAVFQKLEFNCPSGCNLKVSLYVIGKHSEMSSFILLESSDKQLFRVAVDTARMCGTIAGMLDDLGEQEGDDKVPIPIHAVNAETLDKVLTWAAHHKHDAQGVEIAEFAPQVSAWDQSFLDVDQKTLFDLIIAANYLDIKRISALAARKVANTITGKTAEEMRAILGLENDLAPEEVDQIKKENAFLMTEKSFRK